MIDKYYISADELLQDSFKLGAKIYNSQFVPEFIIGIWRGGSPVGIAIQEFLDYLGVKTDHIAIRTASYTGIKKRADTVQVFGLNYILNHLKQGQKLLIVDDVFDTGLSIDAVLNSLDDRLGFELGENVKVAVPWFKPANNKTNIEPDFYLHETDKWLVFPHELDGLTKEEILENKPGLKEIFKDIKN